MVTVSENNMSAKYYTISNNQEFVDDDGYYRLENNSDKVCAKAMKESKGKNILKRNANYYKYYVKVASNKSLYDPFETHSIKDNRVSFIDKIKDNGSNFIEVNHSVFNKYINYLKTQNSQWLTEAKRELT